MELEVGGGKGVGDGVVKITFGFGNEVGMDVGVGLTLIAVG